MLTTFLYHKYSVELVTVKSKFILLVFIPAPLMIVDNFQEYSFQITMRQQWNDKRLNFKHRLKGQLKGKGP